MTLIIEHPPQVNDVIMEIPQANEFNSKLGVSPTLGKVGWEEGSWTGRCPWTTAKRN